MESGDEKINGFAAGAAPIAAGHTPGPWQAVQSKKGWHVACNTHVVVPTFKSEANARLIAAAPDMVSTLRTIARSEVSDFSNPEKALRIVINLARAALAKATAPVDEAGKQVLGVSAEQPPTISKES